MRFYLPTEIVSERNCLAVHGEKIKEYGKTCLIVTGRHSAKITGALDDLLSVLNKEGIKYIIYDKVEENPSIETVMEARELGVTNNAEFVIGVGGGSPLDAAKAIALMIENKEEDESILFQQVPLKHLPVVAIPTTAGTGSEATPYSILTIHKERTKRSISHRIFPVLALNDYSYLAFAKDELLINTAVDALSHLIESYLNTNADTYSKIFSQHGLLVWAASKEALFKRRFTDIDYNNLMNASTIAGMAISHTGTSLPHGLSYSVTYEKGISHGRAVGIFIPGFLRLYAINDKTSVDKVISILGFENIDDFENYLEHILGSVMIEEDLMLENVRVTLNNKAKMANYPFHAAEEQIRSSFLKSTLIEITD